MSATWIAIGSIGFTMLIFNAIFLGIILNARRKAAKASEWPSTTGTVKTSMLEARSDSEGGTFNYPVVVYTYKVMGQEYEGRRVAPGVQWGGTGAERVVARYPAGSQVTVSYDPEKPSDALLETKSPGWLMWMWVAMAVFDVFMCGVAAIAVVSLQAGT